MAGLKSKLYRSVDWCQPIRTEYVCNKCQSLNWYDSKWTKSDNNAFESDFEVVFNFHNAKVDASLVVIGRQKSTYPQSQIKWDAMQMQLLMSYDNYAPGWDLTWGQYMQWQVWSQNCKDLSTDVNLSAQNWMQKLPRFNREWFKSEDKEWQRCLWKWCDVVLIFTMQRKMPA